MRDFTALSETLPAPHVDELLQRYFMAGEESFLCKARVKTIGDLERLLVELNRVKGVARTRTAIALSTKWESRAQPATES